MLLRAPRLTPAALRQSLQYVRDLPWDGLALTAPLDVEDVRLAKYDRFLPEALLRQAYAADRLDASGAQAAFARAVDGFVTQGAGSPVGVQGTSEQGT